MRRLVLHCLRNARAEPCAAARQHRSPSAPQPSVSLFTTANPVPQLHGLSPDVVASHSGHQPTTACTFLNFSSFLILSRFQCSGELETEVARRLGVATQRKVPCSSAQRASCTAAQPRSVAAPCPTPLPIVSSQDPHRRSHSPAPHPKARIHAALAWRHITGLVSPAALAQRSRNTAPQHCSAADWLVSGSRVCLALRDECFTPENASHSCSNQTLY